MAYAPWAQTRSLLSVSTFARRTAKLVRFALLVILCSQLFCQEIIMTDWLKCQINTEGKGRKWPNANYCRGDRCGNDLNVLILMVLLQSMALTQ